MEIREILCSVAGGGGSPAGGLGTDIATLFDKAGLTQNIPELRGHEIKLQHRDPTYFL